MRRPAFERDLAKGDAVIPALVDESAHGSAGASIGRASPYPTHRVGDLFLNENLNHPENRINVALFGLMTQNWLRLWFLKKLGLAPEAIIYPPTNWSGVRPDLKVASVDGVTLAWIEVEIGTNPAQVADYRSRLSEPIKTVLGRRRYGGDLSLEEIAEFLADQHGQSPQVNVNIQHLHDQIRQALSQSTTSSSIRAEVSDEMRRHPLVVGLTERLGKKLQFTTGVVRTGHLRADTTKSQGFSLRVVSRVSSSGTLSILAISGGRPSIIFPSRTKLEKYLPAHKSEIGAYAQVLAGLGCDIGAYAERQRPSLPLESVLSAIDEISTCAARLADRPGSTV